jgi:hypothetical protein
MIHDAGYRIQDTGYMMHLASCTVHFFVICVDFSPKFFLTHQIELIIISYYQRMF